MFWRLKKFLKRFLPPSANTFHAFVLDWEARVCEERAWELEQKARIQELLAHILTLEKRIREMEERSNFLDQRTGALVSHTEVWETQARENAERTQALEVQIEEGAKDIQMLMVQAREIGRQTRALAEKVDAANSVLTAARSQINAMTLYSENRPWNEQISLMLEVWLGAKRLHAASFAGYKDKYLGWDVVLCGAGPTLNYYTPTLRNAVYVALNRAFLNQAISFDYIFSADWRGIRPIQDALAAYQGNHCVKLLARQTYSVQETGFPDAFIARCGAVSFYGDDYRTSFTRDVMNEPLRTTFTSALAALQLFLYTHPKRIYLVGIDMSDGHFNDAEGERKTLWWSTADGQLAPPVMSLWQDFKGFAAAYYPDVEIISVNPVRLKGLFRDEYTNAQLKALNRQKEETT